MAEHAQSAGLLEVEAFMSHYDTRTQNALERWLADLPADVHDAVRDTLQDAAGSTRAWWAAVESGTPEPPSGEPEDETFPLQPAGGLVAAVGAEDGDERILELGA